MLVTTIQLFDKVPIYQEKDKLNIISILVTSLKYTRGALLQYICIQAIYSQR